MEVVVGVAADRSILTVRVVPEHYGYSFTGEELYALTESEAERHAIEWYENAFGDQPKFLLQYAKRWGEEIDPDDTAAVEKAARRAYNEAYDGIESILDIKDTVTIRHADYYLEWVGGGQTQRTLNFIDFPCMDRFTIAWLGICWEKYRMQPSEPEPLNMHVLNALLEHYAEQYDEAMKRAILASRRRQR